MPHPRQLVLGAVAALAVGLLLSGCSQYRSTTPSNASSTRAACGDLLQAVIRYERTGTGDINAYLDALSGSCAGEYEVAVDYLSAPRPGSVAHMDDCDELLKYNFEREAVALLEEDGVCSFGGPSVPAPASPEWPEGGLGWDEASAHVGTVQRVCGPLTSLRVTDDGTFVNVGRDYPSADRFTFIFWDYYLEPIESGAVVCGVGGIYLYNGVTQMEMGDPGALEIWR